jgi:hypothetical protein
MEVSSTARADTTPGTVAFAASEELKNPKTIITVSTEIHTDKMPERPALLKVIPFSS